MGGRFSGLGMIAGGGTCRSTRWRPRQGGLRVFAFGLVGFLIAGVVRIALGGH